MSTVASSPWEQVTNGGIVTSGLTEAVVKVPTVNVTWTKVPTATGYELHMNGKKVATAGAKASSSKFTVKDGDNLIEVFAIMP